MERVLAFGGREFNDRAAVYRKLDDMHARHPIDLLITGACPNRKDDHGNTVYSADMLAQEWALSREIPYVGWPAKWRSTKLQRPADWKLAGFERNQTMLQKTRPTRGCEFPGGNGTKDMRERLVKARIPVE